MGNASTKSLDTYAGLQGILLRVVDVGILGILFLAPLFMGGRHPVGRFVFVAIVVLTSIAWFARQCVLPRPSWRSSAGQWILLCTVVLLLLQLVPLSPSWFARLSPDAADLLPLWFLNADSPALLGTWSQLSMNPASTLDGLAILLAYGLTFWIIVQRVNCVEDIHRILRWMALAALGMAVLGLAQYLSSNGKFLWTYEHPHREANQVQGPFINRNHFCHLLVLGTGPLACWLVMRLRKHAETRRGSFRGFAGGATDGPLVSGLVGIALAVVAFTAVMTSSRGGIIALTVALVLISVVYFRGSLLGKRHFVGLVVGVLVLGVSLAIHGSDHVATKLDTLKTLSLEQIDRGVGRKELWGANWLSITGSPWFGRGVGTHREYYKMFLPESTYVEFTHAENGYIQIGGETGVAGVALLAAALGVCVFWCLMALRGYKHRGELAAIGAVIAALAASATHALVDFVWFIPACMSWTLIIMALACRLYQLTGKPGASDGNEHLPRAYSFIAVACVLAISAWMLQTLAGPALASRDWESYMKYSRQRWLTEYNATQQSLPGVGHNDPQLDEARAALDRRLAKHLSAYLARDPNNARVHLRLSATLLRQFQQQQQHGHNPMDVAQIRDAAMASRFASRAALNEWLDRAIGPHRVLLDRALWHARQAVGQCPLQGEGYLFLAELCFLEGANSEVKAAYVEQALRVRPYDGSVLLMAGKEAAIAGDVQKALEFWRQSYQGTLRNKQELVSLLAGRVPAPFLLEVLQPSADDWLVVYSRYQKLGQAEEIKVICDYFFRRADQHPDDLATPSRVWVALSNAYHALDEQELSEGCARRAFDYDPETFEVRLLVAKTLMRRERFADAEKHLRWCMARRPDASGLRGLLEKAVKGRVAQTSRTAAMALPDGSVPTQQR